MKKLIFAVTLLALMAGITMGADMIAGNPKNPPANVVGEVTVTNDGSNIIVTYTITDDDWHILTTHLAIWEPGEDVGPKVTGGGPPPGQFPWSTPDAGSTDTVVVYTIPLSGNFPGKNNKEGDAYDWTTIGDYLYVAAHAVVREGICDCEELLAVLPTEITADIFYPGDDSYFTVTVTGDGILDGIHRGWCANADDEITPAVGIPGQVYSSICEDLLELPEGLIGNPLNLDMVNWLLNNWETLPGGYTAGDVQYVIWMLLSGHVPDELESIMYIEGNPWPADQAYDATRVIALEAAARANGVDFVPDCGEVMAVIFVPPEISFEVPAQTVLIEIPAPCCGGDETAWAGIVGADIEGSPPGEVDDDGYTIEFKGSDWAMYFPYTVQEEEE